MNRLICKEVVLFLVCLTLFSWTEAHAGYVNTWQWRNPLPQGNPLNAVAYGNNMFVAVGGKGNIISSPDGITWTSRTTGLMTNLYAVTYSNNTFVAVGQLGTIFTSPDGVNWTQKTSGTLNDLKGITYGNNKFVAVGNNGNILTSANGQDWMTQVSGTYANLSCIAYGNGIFVAVGGDWLTSRDGVSWTLNERVPNQGGYQLFFVIYHNNAFIAAAYYVCGEGGCMVKPGTTILTSADGVTWTEKSFISGGDVVSFVRGNDKFVAAGSGGSGGYGATFTSADGTTWSEQACSTCGYGNLLCGIAYGNNTYVAVGDKGIILVSSDGLSWSDSDSSILRRDGRLNDIAYGSAGFVAVGGAWISTASYEDLAPLEDGYVPIINSSDGSAWTARHSGIAWSTLNTVAYGNNTYVAVGREGIIITSTDGANWTLRSSGTNLEINVIAYGNNTFVAVGNGRIALTSPDGINWTKTTSENIDIPEDMVYGGGLFVAVGYNGLIITSPDGVTWTKRTSGTGNWLKGISYGNNTFVAVGYPGAILTSPDGITWTTRNSGTTNELTGIAYGNNTFAVVGSLGTILSSFDGKTWVVKNPVTNTVLYKIAFGNDTFVAVGSDTKILQSVRDNTPDQFTLTRQTDVTPGTVVTSNTITVSGIYPNASISVAGGTYSINGGAYTNTNSTVNNGDTVTVQLISPNSYDTTTYATITINDVSSAFSVTTMTSSTGGDSSGGGSGCFIATAAFGSPLHPYVNVLRIFRDKILLTSQMGRSFVDWYYRISPPIAETIKNNEYLKITVRILLIPLIGFSSLCLSIGVMPALVFFGLFLVAAYFGFRKVKLLFNTL